MEVPRQVLAIAGKFPPADYDDHRHASPAEGPDLTANLGRLPLLRVDGVSIGQSAAINQYVAQSVGLYGKTPLEAARIQAIAEHIAELRLAFRGLVPYGVEPSAEALDKWFNEGATDVSGVADGTNRSRYLKWFTGRIEATLQDNGFAVGNSISLADVLLYNVYAEVLGKDEGGSEKPPYALHFFGSLERTNEVVKHHPRLTKILKTVQANPNLQKWLGQRGKQAF